MSEAQTQPQVLKPLKTWSHLAGRRRKPSEYEIVSTNLHYNNRDANAPYELDPELAMNKWYKKNTFGSALQHDDWNAFRDPEEVVYRSYNMMQDGQENYVYGLFDQFNTREHDKSLDPRWAGTLASTEAPITVISGDAVLVLTGSTTILSGSALSVSYGAIALNGGTIDLKGSPVTVDGGGSIEMTAGVIKLN